MNLQKRDFVISSKQNISFLLVFMGFIRWRFGNPLSCIFLIFVLLLDRRWNSVPTNLLGQQNDGSCLLVGS